MSSKTMQTFSLVGTPFYMSPEAITSTGHGLASDIWSFGCLMYEVAALRTPFYEENLNYYSLGEKIKAAQYAPLSRNAPKGVNCLVIADVISNNHPMINSPQVTSTVSSINTSNGFVFTPSASSPLPMSESSHYSQIAEVLIQSMIQVDPSSRPTALQVLEICKRCAAAYAHMLPTALDAYFTNPP